MTKQPIVDKEEKILKVKVIEENKFPAIQVI